MENFRAMDSLSPKKSLLLLPILYCAIWLFVYFSFFHNIETYWDPPWLEQVLRVYGLPVANLIFLGTMQLLGRWEEKSDSPAAKRMRLYMWIISLMPTVHINLFQDAFPEDPYLYATLLYFLLAFAYIPVRAGVTTEKNPGLLFSTDLTLFSLVYFGRYLFLPTLYLFRGLHFIFIQTIDRKLRARWESTPPEKRKTLRLRISIAITMLLCGIVFYLLSRIDPFFGKIYAHTLKPVFVPINDAFSALCDFLFENSVYYAIKSFFREAHSNTYIANALFLFGAPIILGCFHREKPFLTEQTVNRLCKRVELRPSLSKALLISLFILYGYLLTSFLLGFYGIAGFKEHSGYLTGGKDFGFYGPVIIFFNFFCIEALRRFTTGGISKALGIAFSFCNFLFSLVLFRQMLSEICPLHEPESWNISLAILMSAWFAIPVLSVKRFCREFSVFWQVWNTLTIIAMLAILASMFG